MLSEVEFRTDAFSGRPRERTGAEDPRERRLARFLRDALRAQGEPVGEPTAEDWGWVLPIDHSEFRLWIGVGGVDGDPGRFVAFIEPNKQYVRKLWKKVPTARARGRLARMPRRGPEGPRGLPRRGVAEPAVTA